MARANASGFGAPLSLLLSVALLALPAFANGDLPTGYQHLYNLEYDQAIAEFETEVAQHPNAPEGFNHLAQAILYRAMYREGVIENALVSGDDFFRSLVRRPKLRLTAEEDGRIQRALQKAIALSQARLKAEPDDSDALYSEGVAHSFNASYQVLVQKSWVAALREGSKARMLHNRVTARNPAYVDARLIQGMHDYVLATVPLSYRILAAIAGFSGDKAAGIRALELVSNEGRENRIEARMLLAALYRAEKKPLLSVSALDGMTKQFPRNYLIRYALVQAYAEAGDKIHAVEALGDIEQLRRSRAPGYGEIPEATLTLMKASVKLRFQDFDAASDDLAQIRSRPRDIDPGLSARVQALSVQLDAGRRRQQRGMAATGRPSDSLR